MLGFLLILPLFFIRYVLLYALNHGALQRAAHFAPMSGNEKVAYWLYQLSTLLLIVYAWMLKPQPHSLLFGVGLLLYIVSILLLILCMLHFARPSASGVCKEGLYKLSRNPTYVAYFLYFLAIAAMTQSLPYFAFLIVFQLSGHFIILAEERWCLQAFGEEFAAYMKSVRRYVGFTRLTQNPE